jgi:aminocarboxymuconate-semialdehyde decarboxylase
MPVIDAHAHVIPPEIQREANPAETWRPRFVLDPERGARHPVAGDDPITNHNVLYEFGDGAGLLAALNGMGVERALLAPHVGLLRYSAAPEDCLASSRAQNDGITRIVGEHKGAFAGLGTVPLQDTRLAVGELERLMKLGLKGIEVGTNVGGVYLGDRRYRPLWEACQSLGAWVFIHPTGFGHLREHYMSNVVGNPMVTAFAAAHLVLSGTMEALPDLKVLLAHGGGVIPSLRGRMNHGLHVRPEIELPREPIEYCERFYYDTLTHDPQVLRELVGWVGADHVLLGSDYPFDMGTYPPQDVVKAAMFDAETEAKILGGNAAGFFGL